LGKSTHEFPHTGDLVAHNYPDRTISPKKDGKRGGRAEKLSKKIFNNVPEMAGASARNRRLGAANAESQQGRGTQNRNRGGERF
jgi:hypothetical protein